MEHVPRGEEDELEVVRCAGADFQWMRRADRHHRNPASTT
eukprot:COSAG06_NODE_18322_length_893_cov_1.265743_1_plen_39_part_10